MISLVESLRDRIEEPPRFLGEDADYWWRALYEAMSTAETISRKADALSKESAKEFATKRAKERTASARPAPTHKKSAAEIQKAISDVGKLTRLKPPGERKVKAAKQAKRREELRGKVRRPKPGVSSERRAELRAGLASKAEPTRTKEQIAKITTRVAPLSRIKDLTRGSQKTVVGRGVTKKNTSP